MTRESSEHLPLVRDSLRAATRAHKLAALSKASSYLGAGIGLIGVLFVLFARQVTSPGAFASGLLVSLPVFTLFLSVLVFLKMISLQKSRRSLLEKAYASGLVDQMSKSGAGATPRQLAEAFNIDVAMAENLLTQLNVRDDVASEVTDDGQIAYSSPNRGRPIEMLPNEQPATQRLRVSEDDTNAAPGIASDEEDSKIKTQLSSIAKP